jgi:hypothetical protein
MPETTSAAAASRWSIDWLKLSGVLLSLSLFWWFGDSVCSYMGLEKQFVQLSRSLEQKNNRIMALTSGRPVSEYLSANRADIQNYVSGQRLSYTTAEVLSHVAQLSEVTGLADISPRIKETRMRPGLMETRIFIHGKGMYHQLAKFINLLELRKYRYPVRVNKLTIGRSEKDPTGDLNLYAELIFFRLSDEVATKILQSQTWGKGQAGEEDADTNGMDTEPGTAPGQSPGTPNGSSSGESPGTTGSGQAAGSSASGSQLSPGSSNNSDGASGSAGNSGSNGYYQTEDAE